MFHVLLQKHTDALICGPAGCMTQKPPQAAASATVNASVRSRNKQPLSSDNIASSDSIIDINHKTYSDCAWLQLFYFIFMSKW